ncbi:MAG: PAS domain S-box protein [Nitrospirae bacterium]|nr:PAS domain S-box protein [Nitrospirota bacterium]
MRENTALMGGENTTEAQQLSEINRLRESEGKFKLLLDTTGDFILTADAKHGDIRYCNDKFTELLGIPAAEMQGMNLYMIFPAEQREKCAKLLEGSNDKHIVDGLFLEHRKGHHIPVELRTKTVEVDGREILCAIFRDITTRKMLDTQLKKNCQLQAIINSILQIALKPIPLRKQFDLILELILSYHWLAFHAKGSIHIIESARPEMLVMYAQKNFEPIQFKLCSEVPFGKCLCGLAAATHEIVFANSIDDRHDHMYPGMSPHGHYCVPITLGKRVLGVLNLYVNEGHESTTEEEEFLTAVVNTLAGIISRARTEEHLLKNEEQLRSIIQTTDNAIICVNTNEEIVLWNNGAAKIFGYAPHEAAGKPFDIIIPEQMKEAFRKDFKTALETGRSYLLGKEITLTAVRKDGTEFPMELSAALWTVQAGTFFTAILRDITEHVLERRQREHAIEKLRKLTGSVVVAISAILEARDPYTAGHQRRVADLSRAIADEMGYPKDMTEGVRMAASIHDVGKIYVPSEILSKPGKLFEAEFHLLKYHPQIGHDILKDVDFPWSVARIILQHHERIDGSGYPTGIKGDDILIEAKIICVADVVEAMTNHRPYRPALGLDKALEEIQTNSTVLYDEDVVEACLAVFKKGFTFKS